MSLSELPFETDLLELTLLVRDREVIEALERLRGGREREEFALTALRIGVLSLGQARGQVDVQAVRGEVDRLLIDLEKNLTQHKDQLQAQLGDALRDYFDPRHGRFAERVEKLTKDDGELATLILRHVGSKDSELAKTLAVHLGAESPIMKLVDPSNTEGLQATVSRIVNDELASQRDRILCEFSLDNEDGALRRLLSELGEHHGKLTGELQASIDEVVRQFSLDEEGSALARLKGELLKVTREQSDRIHQLEKTLASELAAVTARREAEERAPAHGNEFERELLRYLETAAQRSGDLFEATGTRPGLIKNCKVGDAVIELGPEHQAAGARIVFEAKEAARVRPAKVLAELATAKKNRGADFGVFVHSRRSAPETMAPFSRIGNDLILVWDADDPASDVVLEAGLSVARALSTRDYGAVSEEVDFDAIERAIRDVEKQAGGLNEIKRSAETIQSGSQRILDRVRKMQKNLEEAVAVLDECTEEARRALGED